jgi:hypothetical protein
MNKKIDSILEVNNYLTISKLEEPNSDRIRYVQMYLTHKISKALKEDTKLDVFKILSNIVSYFF